MSDLLDNEIKNASKDFDKVKQAGCEHDREKALSIDVDKILGIASEFEFDKTDVDEIKDEVESVEEFEVDDFLDLKESFLHFGNN